MINEKEFYEWWDNLYDRESLSLIEIAAHAWEQSYKTNQEKMAPHYKELEELLDIL